jgi:hypothetical protein
VVRNDPGRASGVENGVPKVSHANPLTPRPRREATLTDDRLNQKDLEVGCTDLDCRQSIGSVGGTRSRSLCSHGLGFEIGPSRFAQSVMTPVTYCGGHALGTRGSIVPWISRHIQLLSLVIDNEGLHSCPRFRHAQLKHSYAQLSHFRRVELPEGLLADAC